MDVWKSIKILIPNAEFEINANDYKQIIWHDERFEKPSLEQLKDVWSEHVRQRELYRYRTLRDYPALGDQMDELMKWIYSLGDSIPEGLRAMAARCMAVKEETPKPEELQE